MKGLFEEGLKILEGEIMAFVKEKEKTNRSEIAAHFKLSQDNVLLLIGKLVREETHNWWDMGVSQAVGEMVEHIGIEV